MKYESISTVEAEGLNKDLDNPWTIQKTEVVYDNPWINVTHHAVLNPQGQPGIYGTVHFKNLALAILPIDADGYTWLVGQFRFPLAEYSWEIPEGGGHTTEEPLLAAQRELLEETGISAKTWRPCLQMCLSNSVTDERSISFIASGLSFGSAAPEPTEQLQVKRVHFSDVLQMVLRGEITDALSVATILRAQMIFAEEGWPST